MSIEDGSFPVYRLDISNIDATILTDLDLFNLGLTDAHWLHDYRNDMSRQLRWSMGT